MDQLVGDATRFIAAHGAWAGPIVGLLAFGESLALIGLLIPATTVILGVGGLIGVGTLDALPMVLWAIGGAIVGDWVSYGIGRWMGPSIYRRWPLNRHRPIVARTRLFFRKYGLIAVFVGRFLGPIRATIPLVAGVMDMSKRRFQLANIASAALWVPLMFAPGYIAARSLGGATQITEAHLIALVGAVTLLTLGATLITSRIVGDPRVRKRHRRRGQD